MKKVMKVEMCLKSLKNVQRSHYFEHLSLKRGHIYIKGRGKLLGRVSCCE